ncbi:MAG: hypothetical protein RLZZ533_296 [Cyanobacteriota bacterium]|jgi:hypothetical protein
MTSDSSDPPPRTGAPNPLTPETGDAGEEPYRSASLFHTAAPLLGVLLGLCTLTLPLASVITDRDPRPPAPGLATARTP